MRSTTHISVLIWDKQFLEDGTDFPKMSVTDYQVTMRDIPDVQIPWVCNVENTTTLFAGTSAAECINTDPAARPYI